MGCGLPILTEPLPMPLPMNRYWIRRVLQKRSAATITAIKKAIKEFLLLQKIREDLKRWQRKHLKLIYMRSIRKLRSRNLPYFVVKSAWFRRRILAGAYGNRTHPGRVNAPRLVLKTRRHTSCPSAPLLNSILSSLILSQA